MTWFQAIQAFFSMILIDIVNAVYIKQVQNNNAMLTGAISVFVFVLYALLVIDFVTNHWLLIPASLGCFTGAYLGVLINKYMDKKNIGVV